jgi:MoxR-like ATPase
MGGWELFRGDGEAREDAWKGIPPVPAWRPHAGRTRPFEADQQLVDAVNVALHLRRPLLLTGPAGSGKSALVDQIARELDLGEVLRWHVTSRSTLEEGLYRYDALGHLHASQVARKQADRIEADGHDYVGDPVFEAGTESFVTLGPLGTSFASQDRPRAVLIDEIDKSDIDLPGDLLNALEVAEFVLAPLHREVQYSTNSPSPSAVMGFDRQSYRVYGGVVWGTHAPMIVLTSNGERTFPPPFLRRCVQFRMPVPTKEFLAKVVAAHFGEFASEEESSVIEAFAQDLKESKALAIDQLLGLVHLVTGQATPNDERRKAITEIVMTELKRL